MIARAIVAVCITALSASAAKADTTYNYVGSPYIYASVPELGANMTGSVTFNVDTTNFTGIFTDTPQSLEESLSRYRVEAYLVSGIRTAPTNGSGFFIFVAGEITAWRVEGQGPMPIGLGSSDMTTSSSPFLPPPNSASGFDNFEQVHHPHLGDPPFEIAHSGAPGHWTIAVPAPAMNLMPAGAGLPALLAFAWLGWKRSRRSRDRC